MKRVIFICLGNICRSPAAEAIFNKMISEAGDIRFPKADSAGLHDYHSGEKADVRMRRHGAKRGYDLTSCSRKITINDFANFDLIVAMDRDVQRSLTKIAPDGRSREKIRLFTDFCTNAMYDEVPDPYYGGDEGFELVLDILEDGMGKLIDSLIKIGS